MVRASSNPGITAAWLNSRVSASTTSTLPPGVTVTIWPLPRLIATPADDGRSRDAIGSLENENTRAPGVRSASSTDRSPPSRLSCRYCSHDPSLTTTPERFADHSTSSDESQASGSASFMLTSAAFWCRSPTWRSVFRRKSLTVLPILRMSRSAHPRSPGESPVPRFPQADPVSSDRILLWKSGSPPGSSKRAGNPWLRRARLRWWRKSTRSCGPRSRRPRRSSGRRVGRRPGHATWRRPRAPCA